MSLKEFSGPQIKRFRTILLKQMKKIYHWNVWALAYAAQNGCSDDAFEEFRNWLILQGREACEKAIEDPFLVVNIVPEGLGTVASSLLTVPEAAYELRTGRSLIPKELNYGEPKGKRWEEDQFPQLFPELWNYYESARAGN